MSDTPEEDQARFTTTHPAPRGSSRWMAPVALLIAVVAVAVAIWSLMSGTSPSTSPAASGAASQPGDATTRVCTAFDTVVEAVSLQTHADVGEDPVARTAVAGNSRLALFGGGQYLLNSLDSKTPSKLANAVREFAHDLQEIGMYALGGALSIESEQAARLAQGDISGSQLAGLCSSHRS